MTDYTALANGIKTTLEADSWVGDLANVKTIETYKREVALQGIEGFPYFTITELPALSIYPNRGKAHESRTVTLDTNAVRSEIAVVSYNSVKLTAAQEHFAILKNVEAVLNSQKTETNDMGIGAYVDEIEVETRRFKKGTNFFYFSIISFTVELSAAIATGLLFDDATGLFDDATGDFDDK